MQKFDIIVYQSLIRHNCTQKRTLKKEAYQDKLLYVCSLLQLFWVKLTVWTSAFAVKHSIEIDFYKAKF